VSWRTGTVRSLHDETATARTLVLDVPGWPGHNAGQHVDIRLTAPDGYSATRSYSIASASDGTSVEVTVDRLEDGEVSPYLTQVVEVGDQLELRGPLGGWFVWRPEQTEHVQLVAGGSGLVPLMAMLRTRQRAGASTPMRLLYSVREPVAALYSDELPKLAAGAAGEGDADLTYAWTRVAPSGTERPPGRVDKALVAAVTWPPDLQPTCYVCGPTGFVEQVADLLVAAGHDTKRIRTERFGPTGGGRR
jgi:ferredoxin-NADP reductase